MGLQLIYMNDTGEKKEVSDHLAFDISLQKSMNFFPCDETGAPVPAPENYQSGKQPEKKSVAAGSPMKEAVIIPPSESNTIVVEPTDEEIRATIIKLHGEGKTPGQISKEVGKHHKQVTQIINAK